MKRLGEGVGVRGDGRVGMRDEWKRKGSERGGERYGEKSGGGIEGRG